MSGESVKVSVIIPVYNVEKYLGQCIESVISQTLKEIEIICIDDGSTDNSPEILKRYAESDPRLSVYSKPNAGYGHTINYGLEKSHGKYISIVESDDFIDERGMELLYDSIEKYKVDYVRTNFFGLSNGMDRFNDSLKRYPYNQPLSPVENLSLFLFMPCQPWGCIYNRFFLDNNNIRMNETPGASYQDASWTFMILLKAERVVFIEEAFYHYRLDNADSSMNSCKKIFCVVDEKEYMEKKLAEYKIFDPDILAIYARMIYGNYKWNYDRISNEFQYAFLLEWRKELLNQLSEGILKRQSFEETQWKEIENIIYDMENYFEKTAKEYTMKGICDFTINEKMYYDAFVEKILQNKIIIFGTGVVANIIACFLKKRYAFENIICFCETKPAKGIFHDKKVFPVQSMPYSKEILIVCAVFEKTQRYIVTELRNMGFLNIVSVDGILIQKIKSDM